MEKLGQTNTAVKEMYLAYPICRYANENLAAELTKEAPKWSSSVSGNDAPPLWTFRQACKYSETRAAMLFAEKYHDLDAYAEIRGTDADTIRDLLDTVMMRACSVTKVDIHQNITKRL